MVQSLVSTLIAVCILVGGAIFEQSFVTKQFSQFEVAVETLKQKAENGDANADDMKALRENWLARKKYLHVFIPHNEIKELELWLSEAVSFSEYDDRKELADKLEVLLSLSKEIPKTFLISFENIM